jgi:hypothetical protein
LSLLAKDSFCLPAVSPALLDGSNHQKFSSDLRLAHCTIQKTPSHWHSLPSKGFSSLLLFSSQRLSLVLTACGNHKTCSNLEQRQKNEKIENT